MEFRLKRIWALHPVKSSGVGMQGEVVRFDAGRAARPCHAEQLYMVM